MTFVARCKTTPRLSLARSTLAAMLAVTASACGPEGDVPNEQVGASELPIKGGNDDTTDTGVVAFVDLVEGSLCSGSLIAPNVILTARHCVSAVLGSAGGGVDCSKTYFDGIVKPDAFFVTTAAVVTQANIGQYRVHDVIGLPKDRKMVCGDDMAILILTGNVTAKIAIPYEPRVDVPVAADDAYTAIGYGAVDDGSAGAGTRRVRKDLKVACVGADCEPATVTKTEWTGETGICHGDSGGPAIDADGRVAGVVSRGMSGCDAPIYEHVQAFADWIKDTVVIASGYGKYVPPAWTAGSHENPQHGMSVGDPCTQDGDCYSKHCVVQGGAGFCSRECDADAACPEQYACSTDAPHLCVEKSPTPAPPTQAYGQSPGRSSASGCALGQRGDGDEAPFVLALAVAGFAAWARRRRRWDVFSRARIGGQPISYVIPHG